MKNQQAWLLLESGPRAAGFNMALDEALLEAAPQTGAPVLRFYGWTEPAASFGYFQKYADVERTTALRPLVRRPTGGGIVPHDADWTYSLAFPAGHEWYALTAAQSYQRAHEWIARAFGRLGIQTELAKSCHRTGPGQCFAGHEKFDVLWTGRKIAGAAQRRTRAGLLIQGSIQPPPVPVARADWEKAMREAADPAGQVFWSSLDAVKGLSERATELARLKYSQPSYNQRR
jgi:lipoyl(octanoyl) transferase